MPENTRNSLSLSAHPLARGILIGAASLVLVASGFVSTVTAQSAAAQAGHGPTSVSSPATRLRADDAVIRQKRHADAVNAAAAAAAAAQAAYLATPAGAQATAQAMAASQYGWGDGQFGCLVSLWDRESGWNVNSYNADSGAAGIPQALPGEKMAIAGADWQTNPATQIAWGLGYIASSYGTPCAAWNHSQSYNWY
ncbi:hypothetical protein BH11ACT4_BH11ACT4_17360 [soil metagenome]